MRFSLEDIRRFANWSADRNPLHVDAEVARRTFFGQPIAHGMLSVLGALSGAGAWSSGKPLALDIEFRGAVRPDVTHDVSSSIGDDDTHLAVRSSDAQVLSIRLAPCDAPVASSSGNVPEGQTTAAIRTAPAERDEADLEAKPALTGAYSTPDVPAEYLGEGPLAPVHVRVLALCSYLVGMELPGLKSLFTRASLRLASPADDSSTLVWRLRTMRFDRQFRLLETQIEVATPGGRLIGTGTLRSYVRFGPVVLNPAELAARLSGPAKALAGSTALIVGGTRGLGADMTVALAAAGCRVYASFNRDREAASDLERQLQQAGLHAVLVQGDAGDPEWCAAAVEQIRRQSGRLDLLILNACAMPEVLPAGKSDTERSARYVSENLRLVQVPLAQCLSEIHDSGGAIAYISSSAVEEPPPGWGPYVAVKMAGEGLLRTAARESNSFDALIVRPPRLQTSWSDTPTGAVGAIPTSWVASHVVNRLGDVRGSKRVEMLTAFPPFAPADASAAHAGEPRTAFDVAVAGSFTIDPLLPGLRFWMDVLRLEGDVQPAPYGQVVQTLLDPAGVFASPRRGLNVALLCVGDWIRELPADEAESLDHVRAHLERAVTDFDRAMRTHRARGGRPTLLMVCPTGALAAEIARLVARAEDEVVARSSGLAGLQIVRCAAFHDRYGVAAGDVHDPLRDRIGHIPYRDEYFHVLATIAMRRAHRRIAPAYKVVVVDADNTLWRGVVGEVGADGVAFDTQHRALHRELVRLSESGVVLAICSKNEESDVWEVFDTRSDFGLRREHIVGAAINWQSKSQNLGALASRLNLGLDSFIFIDDNPVECAEVRAHCPEVLTLEWPQDPDAAIRLLEHTWELDTEGGTAEDRRRTEMYREELQRRELREGALTLREFLDSLDLRVDIAPLTAEDLRRASQLTLRTNQFNFTTRRRDEAEVQALVAGGQHEIRTVRVRDRFGDYGLVGVLVAEWHENELVADTFLLSCRVLGRGVEHHMAAEFGRMAQARGAETVTLRIDFTKKNTPARLFLQAIAPSGQLSVGEDRMEWRTSSGELAGLRFEPAEDAGGGQLEADDEIRPSAAPVPTSSLRGREAQIVRTAMELSTPRALAQAIGASDTRSESAESAEPVVRSSVGAPPGAVAAQDIADTVSGAFANALRMSQSKVVEIDRLEALGCDSLKIVEITVELIDAFPWVPPTLLFEHRTVSEIARAISALREPVALQVAAARAGRADTAGARRPPVGRHEGALDIAVVGMHVRCAGANSPEDLWALLSTGRSAVREVPVNRRYFLHALTDTRPHWAGLLDDVDRFDAELFGVSPREAEYMDPQLRLFLEVAWSALEDAGCAGTGHEAGTGVFAGVMYSDYGSRANVAAGAASPYRCWEGFSLANRLSQLLGFSGPSLAVDTACSSSGTALHLACAALKAGDCRVAVVGGVNLILDPDRFGSLGRLGILSMRGKCEPFGADADGTVLGEGAGVVVLRPLDEAIRRGDRIHGVIKGTGLSTGSGTVGFTAPNPQAQAEAIRRSLQSAHVDPRTISYVETHGTGTALGDPIEVRGLTLGYGGPELHDEALDIDHRCTLGSIKPNIGHLEAGAGVLGLIKVLLQFQHRMLLPSITSERANPQIPFAQSAFDVQRTLAEWRAPVARAGAEAVPVPRRAGLSSFGVGGANAHVIVEEPPTSATTAAPIERPVHLLALSARIEASLRQQASNLLRYTEQHPEVRVSDVCHSVANGRRHFDHRAAAPVATRDDMQAWLRDIALGEPPGGARNTIGFGSAPKIAFLFTGQGSQYAGMGRELYATQPVFRDAVDRAALVLDRLLGRPLLDVMFAREGTADAELINQTAYTQPALFVFEYAMSCLWRSWGVEPDVVVGHSIGEIAAMCVAGGMSLDDGLRLVEARGRLMQALPAGGVMTSAMTDEARVRAAMAGMEDRVAIAAVNAPGQVVISGDGAAVARITEQLTTKGIKTRPLTVSHAFHSPLMKPMVAEYERVVRGIELVPPAATFVSSVSPDTNASDGFDRTEYWLRNVIDPVRFADAMKALEAAGVDVCIEVGPQPVLLGLGRQSVTDADGIEWLPSLRKDASEWMTLLASAARLYARGASIDWQGFDAPYPRTRVSAPTYAFGGREHWLKSLTQPAIERKPALYEIAWRESERIEGEASRGEWIILADQRGVGAALADALHEKGVRTTLVAAGTRFEATGTRSYTIDPSSPEQLASLWAAVTREGAVAQRIVHLWSLDAPIGAAQDVDTMSRAAGRSVSSVVHTVQALAGASVVHPALWVVTQGAVTPPFALAQAPVWGLGRTISLEHPDLWGGLIDIPNDDPELAARLLAHEIMSVSGDDQVALTGIRRLVPRLVPRAAAPAERLQTVVRPDGTYLITGGAGALGLHVARWLIRRGARHLVLASRRATLDDPSRVAIESLERDGTTIAVVPADVSKAEDVDALLARIASGPLPLRGIIHAAGVDSTIPVTAMTASDLEHTLAAKVRGGWILHERTRTSSLDFFVGFSSLASVLGSQGHAHYAAANAFLDALAAERRRLGLPGTSINWGPWRGGGLAGPELLGQFERIGNHGLDPDSAIDTLDAIVSAGSTQVAAAAIDWTVFAPVFEARRSRPMLAEVVRPTLRADRDGRFVPDDRDSDDDSMSPDSLSGVAPPGDDGSPEWIAVLRPLPASDREAELTRLLQREVAETLGFDGPASVGLHRNFYEMGMDSLMMADLVGRLKKRVGISCGALVFDHPDVRSLAGKLIDRLRFEEGAVNVHAEVGRVPRPVHRSLGEGGGGLGDRPLIESGMTAVALEEPSVSRHAGGNGVAEDPEIFAFQAIAFPQRSPDLIPARWRWMIVDSARRLGRAPLVWLHRDAGAIVGHMGSIPVRLKLANEEHDTGWLVDTMVLATHRNQAVGSRLMVEAHEDQPFSLSLGQTAEMREIQFRLGWKQVAPLQVAQLLVRPVAVLKGKLPGPAAYAASLGFRASATLRDLLSERRTCEARVIDRFDTRHDRLWAEASRDLTCAVVRDASYLNWKYVDQPGQQFLRLELLEGDELKGIAVWMFRNVDEHYRYRRAFLVDLVTPLSDGPSLRRVIRTACAAAAAGEADALLCHHIEARLTDALRDCGFHLRKPERFLLVDPGRLPEEVRDRALSASSWFVTQGDSDIDRPW